MSHGVDSLGFEYFTEVFSKEYKVDKSVLSGVARQVWDNELTDADRASWEEMARQSRSQQAAPKADAAKEPEPARDTGPAADTAAQSAAGSSRFYDEDELPDNLAEDLPGDLPGDLATDLATGLPGGTTDAEPALPLDASPLPAEEPADALPEISELAMDPLPEAEPGTPAEPADKYSHLSRTRVPLDAEPLMTEDDEGLPFTPAQPAQDDGPMDLDGITLDLPAGVGKAREEVAPAALAELAMPELPELAESPEPAPAPETAPPSEDAMQPEAQEPPLLLEQASQNLAAPAAGGPAAAKSRKAEEISLDALLAAGESPLPEAMTAPMAEIVFTSSAAAPPAPEPVEEMPPADALADASASAELADAPAEGKSLSETMEPLELEHEVNEPGEPAPILTEAAGLDQASLKSAPPAPPDAAPPLQEQPVEAAAEVVFEAAIESLMEPVAGAEPPLVPETQQPAPTASTSNDSMDDLGGDSILPAAFPTVDAAPGIRLDVPLTTMLQPPAAPSVGILPEPGRQEAGKDHADHVASTAPAESSVFSLEHALHPEPSARIAAPVSPVPTPTPDTQDTAEQSLSPDGSGEGFPGTDEFTFQLDETGEAVELLAPPPGMASEPVTTANTAPPVPPVPPASRTAAKATPPKEPAVPADPSPQAISLDLQRELLSRLAAKHPLSREGSRPASTPATEDTPQASPVSSRLAGATPRPEPASEHAAHDASAMAPSPAASQSPVDKSARFASPARQRPVVDATSTMARPGDTSIGRPRRESRPERPDSRPDQRPDHRAESTAERQHIPQQHMHPAIFAKVRQYIEDHALALTKVMVERALKGDSQCLTWCMDHVWPKPETPAPPLAIPALTNQEQAAAFGTAILQALSQGGLTLEQAEGYMALLKDFTSILEMDEFKKRLLALEQSQRGGGAAKRQKITLGAFEKPF